MSGPYIRPTAGQFLDTPGFDGPTVIDNLADGLDALDILTAAIQASLNVLVINGQTASYTLVLTDAGKVVELTVSTANTLTVPPNSAVAFPVGSLIEICQMGTGQTAISPGNGVTLRSNGARLKLSGQFASASLRKRATDEWVVSGDLTT